jgi:hypothetical protein
MCPFCFASTGVLVAGAVSTGGLVALAVKVSRKKSSATAIASNERSSQDAYEQNREPENRIAR